MVNTYHHFDHCTPRYFHREKPTGSWSQKVVEMRDVFSRGLQYVSLLASPNDSSKLQVSWENLSKRRRKSTRKDVRTHKGCHWAYRKESIMQKEQEEQSLRNPGRRDKDSELIERVLVNPRVSWALLQWLYNEECNPYNRLGNSDWEKAVQMANPSSCHGLKEGSWISRTVRNHSDLSLAGKWVEFQHLYLQL